LTYALPMRPGYRYRIQVGSPVAFGPNVPIEIHAEELSAAGDVAQAFEPVHSQGDGRACRAKAKDDPPH